MNEIPKELQESIDRNLEGLKSSGIYLQYFSATMTKADLLHPDWQVALTLGAAILLGKPLLFIVRPQDEAAFPPKLMQIADLVIRSDDAEDMARQIAEFAGTLP